MKQVIILHLEQQLRRKKWSFLGKWEGKIFLILWINLGPNLQIIENQVITFSSEQLQRDEYFQTVSC